MPLKQEAQVAGAAVPDRGMLAQAMIVAALWALDLWIILQMRHAFAVLGTLCFVVGPLAVVIFWHVRPGHRGGRNPIA